MTDRYAGSREPPPMRPTAHPQQRTEDDDTWYGEQDPEPAAPPPQKRQRGWLRILLIVVAVLVVLAAGLFAAIQFRLVDLGQLGLGSGGSPARVTGETIDVFPASGVTFTAPTGNTVQEDSSLTWIRSKLRAANPADATDGAHIELPSSLLPRIEGRPVRVTISARSGATGEAPPFAAAYSTVGKGNSGWVVFTPTAEFEDFSFNHRIPIGEVGSEENTHVIAIWADINGTNAPLAIRSITIEPR